MNAEGGLPRDGSAEASSRVGGGSLTHAVGGDICVLTRLVGIPAGVKHRSRRRCRRRGHGRGVRGPRRRALVGELFQYAQTDGNDFRAEDGESGLIRLHGGRDVQLIVNGAR